jgi:hypothetical protein
MKQELAKNRQIVKSSTGSIGPRPSLYAKAPLYAKGERKRKSSFFYSLYLSKPCYIRAITVKRPAADLSALMTDVPAVRVRVLAGTGMGVVA